MAKSKKSGTSSKELLDSLNNLTSKIDAMLKLFTEAAEELKVEEKNSPMDNKLDKIIDQNKTIADGIIVISEMLEDSYAKQKKMPPKQDFSEPNLQKFEPNFNEPTKPRQQAFDPEYGDLLEPLHQESPKPVFNELQKPQQQERPELKFDDLLEPEHQEQHEPQFNEPPEFQQEGPIAMPNIPFSDIEKPKKRGLFGRFKK